MKKVVLFLVFALALAINANANKITVNGRNNGTTITTTTTTNPDGSSITTTTANIECDSWYNETCYTIETSFVTGGSDVLTLRSDPTPVVTGRMVSHNLSTNTVVFIVE